MHTFARQTSAKLHARQSCAEIVQCFSLLFILLIWSISAANSENKTPNQALDQIKNKQKLIQDLRLLEKSNPKFSGDVQVVLSQIMSLKGGSSGQNLDPMHENFSRYCYVLTEFGATAFPEDSEECDSRPIVAEGADQVTEQSVIVLKSRILREANFSTPAFMCRRDLKECKKFGYGWLDCELTMLVCLIEKLV